MAMHHVTANWREIKHRSSRAERPEYPSWVSAWVGSSVGSLYLQAEFYNEESSIDPSRSIRSRLALAYLHISIRRPCVAPPLSAPWGRRGRQRWGSFELTAYRLQHAIEIVENLVIPNPADEAAGATVPRRTAVPVPPHPAP